MFKIISNFILFCIFGFIGEFIHCTIRGRKSGKLLNGPWCPLYGLGGLVILFIIDILPENILIIYIVGVIISSIIEYLSSLILEKIFQKKWWDYKGRLLNINGRICLENSLLFGLMALLLNYIYLPLKEKIDIIIPYKTQMVIMIILFLLIILDFILIIKNKLKANLQVE